MLKHIDVLLVYFEPDVDFLPYMLERSGGKGIVKKLNGLYSLERLCDEFTAYVSLNVDFWLTFLYDPNTDYRRFRPDWKKAFFTSAAGGI